MGFYLQGETYFYKRNGLQQIIAIVDVHNTPLIEYSYDAFGVVTIRQEDYFLSRLNPFLYQGYVYDQETQLYYCQTRYYDPEVGRFISPDSIDYLDSDALPGLHRFLYCQNNPVMFVDNDGCSPKWYLPWTWTDNMSNVGKVLLGIGVIAGLGFLTAVTGGWFGVIAGAAFYGAVSSAVSGIAIGAVIGGITGGWEGILNGAIEGFVDGAIMGGISGALLSGINIATGGVKIIGSAQKT